VTELSAVAAALPVLFYVLTIWWLDRYEREPFWLVAATFLYGATFAVGFALAGSMEMLSSLGDSSLFTQAAIVAPIVEEPAKAGILFLLLASRHFDNTTDGLVYGAAAGLGFAMTENFLYFKAAHAEGGVEAWGSVVVIRSLFSALMHCAATATFGAFLGAFRYRGTVKQWVVAPLFGFVVSVAIHMGFNGALVASQLRQDASLTALGLGLVPIAGLTLFIVTQVVLSYEHAMIRKELLAEAKTGLLPEAHAKVLPYYFKRRRSGWMAGYEHVDQEAYVRTATLLAFRRHQAERVGSGSRIAADADKLRKEIRQLLAPNAA